MSDTRDDVVVSFKPHPGYDSPLIAIKGATPAEVADKIGALEETGLPGIIGNFDAALKAQYNLGRGLGAEPMVPPSTVEATGGVAQVAPEPAAPQVRVQSVTTPPGMTAPTCQHGTKTYKSGRGKNGREWEAWMCPAPKGTQDQCSPEWIR